MTAVTPFLVGDYRVEPSLLRVSREGGETRVEAKSMGVLVYLARHAGRAVSRAELEADLWPGLVVTEDAVTNTIVKLRRALGDSARRPRVIETIPKTGYRLIAEVTWLEPAEKSGKTGAAEIAQAVRPRYRRIAGWLAAVLVVVMLLVSRGLFDPGQDALTRSGPPVETPALAILPLQNLGPSPAQDYLANGVTADLITDLSKLSRLSVVAPGSAFADLDDEERARITGGRGVDYVLTGTVQRLGERLRVNVRLMDTGNARALWGERYEGGMDDIFVIQDRLTSDVISALKVTLPSAERDLIARRPTVSVAAYDQYLRGMEAHGHRSREQNLVARGHFHRAIELDPAFAGAYTGLALTYSRDAIDGWVETPLSSLERAAELVAIANAIDPALPQVHFVTGQVELFSRRHQNAIQAAQRAIQINPNYADGHALMAWIENYAGRTDRADASMAAALRLNPRATASYLEVLGEIRFVQGRYIESAAVFRQVLDINPNYARARMWLAAALAQAGDADGAAWEAVELRVLSPAVSLERLGFAFPFKDPRRLDEVLDALRKAGLPDAG